MKEEHKRPEGNTVIAYANTLINAKHSLSSHQYSKYETDKLEIQPFCLPPRQALLSPPHYLGWSSELKIFFNIFT